MRRASSLLIGLALSSCSSADTVREERAFRDAAGRSCVALIEKSSNEAPVAREAVSCDGEPKACSAESSACYQLSEELDSNVLRNCPACCKGQSSSFASADCSPVQCETSADCVFQNASCEANLCVCPTGFCDD